MAKSLQMYDQDIWQGPKRDLLGGVLLLVFAVGAKPGVFSIQLKTSVDTALYTEAILVYTFIRSSSVLTKEWLGAYQLQSGYTAYRLLLGVYLEAVIQGSCEWLLIKLL